MKIFLKAIKIQLLVAAAVLLLFVSLFVKDYFFVRAHYVALPENEFINMAKKAKPHTPQLLTDGTQYQLNEAGTNKTWCYTSRDENDESTI